MSNPRTEEVTLQDGGTQLRDYHLAHHLRNFDVANCHETEISRERTYSSLLRGTEIATTKVSVQRGRFGPTSKKSVLKCLSIKYPSAAYLKRLERPRPSPTVSNCEVVTSRFKKGFCAWLSDVMKRQAGEHPLFKR